MSRYQPPHLRTGLGSVGQGTQGPERGANTIPKQSSGMQSRWAPSASPSPGPSSPTRTTARQQPSGSQTFRRHDMPSTQVLASPASDLKPRKATKEWSRPSEMEMLASVSRSGGDGQEGDALKNHATQHAFRHYIDERLEQHYNRFNSNRTDPPKVESKEELESLKSIVLLYRKLREGVTAAHRIDAFAIEVYESSALLAILAHDTSQLVSTLSVLVPGLYTAHDRLSRTSLETSIGNLKITSDRRVLCASLFLLYHLCHLDSQSAFWNHHRELTQGDRPFVPAKALAKVAKAAEALSPRFPNPRLFFTTLRDPSLDPHERVMLTWAEGRIRERALAVLRKAYIDAGKNWIFATLGFTESEGHEWVAKQALRIEGDKVKLRP